MGIRVRNPQRPTKETERGGGEAGPSSRPKAETTLQLVPFQSILQWLLTSFIVAVDKYLFSTVVCQKMIKVWGTWGCSKLLADVGRGQEHILRPELIKLIKLNTRAEMAHARKQLVKCSPRKREHSK